MTYLCARYPAVSHTFVLREIAALRKLGVQVQPVSVRRVPREELLTDRDRAEDARTASLLPTSAGTLLSALARLLLSPRGPGALAAGVRRAFALRRPGMRGTAWQAFYLAEAVLLWDVCRRAGSRHVHAHFANVSSDVALLTAVLGTHRSRSPWTWSFTMHGPSDLWNVDALCLAEKVVDAAFVACISDFARSQLMALSPPEAWDRLHIVHCGVEDRHFDAPAESRDGGPVRLLSVGRLAPAKGQLLLLEMARALRERDVPFVLDLVGDGPLRGDLERAVADYGLADAVRLHGSLGEDAVARMMHAADLFVLPSFAEGVPVVAMEAMAAGTPVIATRVAGVAELIDDGTTGRVLPPGRIDVLIEAVEDLIGDDDARSAYGSAGREVVRERYHVDTEARRMLDLLEAVNA